MTRPKESERQKTSSRMKQRENAEIIVCNPHSNFWEILRPGSEDADESMVDCSSESENETEKQTKSLKAKAVPQIAPWGTSEGFKLNNAERELSNNIRKEMGLDVK
eukprot:567243-Rhodomonas_salina.1